MQTLDYISLRESRNKNTYIYLLRNLSKLILLLYLITKFSILILQSLNNLYLNYEHYLLQFFSHILLMFF